MSNTATEIDAFVRAQLQGRLRAGEEIESVAYLTDYEGGMLKALSAKGYFLALTPSDLWMIQTRLGALTPLLENHGVQCYDRFLIRAAAFVGKRLVLVIDGAGELTFVKPSRADAHYSPTQAQLIDTLLSDYGDSPQAKGLKSSLKTKQAIGVALSLLVVVGVGYFQFYKGKAEVSVECRIDPEKKDVECALKHVGGGAAADVCWSVVFTCENKLRPSSRACARVKPKQSVIHRIPLADFRDGDKCDEPTGFDVEDLSID